LFDALTIRVEGKRIEDKKYLCKDCITLLTLSGSLKDTFIIALSPSTHVKCEICNINTARFVVIPYEKGIRICEACLNERGGKHAWHRFKEVDSGEHIKCDLCLRKGARHLIPTPKSDVPLSLRRRGKK